MKQNKFLGVLAIALSLVLSACGNGGGKSTPAGGSSKCKHQWGDYVTVVEETCTEDGKQERTCSLCGEKQEKVIKAGHKWGEWDVTTAATCQAEGARERVCQRCGEKDEEVIAKTDHDWGEWETLSAADCTNAGSRKHACTVCGEEETETVAALGHTWGEWTETLAPTCTEKGSHTHTCSVCGAEEAEAIDALGHDLQLVDGDVPAVEGKATVRLYKCSRCDVTYLGFKANEPSTESLPHLVIGDDGGARFWGRPIGNALALKSDGSSANEQNGEIVYCSTETGDFFEYVFDLTAAQAAELETCRLYCDAQAASYLNGTDFWAYGASNDEWTPGYYIDGGEGHYEVDDAGQPVMVKDHARAPKTAEGEDPVAGEELETEVKMGKRIEDYRYILYVDGQPKDFDPSIKAPTHGQNTNMQREEFVMPYTFHLHEGENRISLRMAGGYRSVFYNFVFRPYEEPETPPEPADPWVEDTETVMPTPAADGALVKRFIQEGKDDVKYEIDVKTANLSVAANTDWKTNPSTGAFKLNNGKTATMKFALPKAFEGKMYQTCYMDSYNNNKTKKMFYETNNHCNIEVGVNGDLIDFSQFATTTFQEVFGDELDGSNSVTKDVELGDIFLQDSNVVTYKRVETLNTIVTRFVFIGKDHNHAFVAGDKAADSALRNAECACGASCFELQAADLTSGQKNPATTGQDNTAKGTRLGKNEFDDIWNITGLAAGTYNVYMQARCSAGNAGAWMNAATAIANGDKATNNGSTAELQGEHRYKIKVDNGDYSLVGAIDAKYSDYGYDTDNCNWSNKPVAQIVVAEGSTSVTLHNMNNGYAIWVYGLRLAAVAA